MSAHVYNQLSYVLKTSIYKVSRTMDSLQDPITSLVEIVFQNCSTFDVLKVEIGGTHAGLGRNVVSL